MRDKVFILFLTILSFMGVVEMKAQNQQTVKGTIVDGTGLPIIGANVIEKLNPTNGTISDFDGNFVIKVKEDKPELIISYLGYLSEEVQANVKTPINVVLREDTEKLDEVVVVGYGVQKKKLVTGATSQVSGDDLGKLSSNGVLGAMQSQVSGVSVGASSGMPGSEEKIVIRGLGTIGNSSPLYVIDGIVGASMSMLNPSDIESIDILKDAASAAIYGSRAANGVVLVTTKKGKKNTYEVRYDGFYAVQNPIKMINGVNAKDYMMLQEEQKGMEIDWESMLPSALYGSIMDGSWQGTNWVEEMRRDNAPMQNHALSIIGGSDRSRFSLGYSYNDQKGIFGVPVDPQFKRHNARMNMDHVLYQKGKLDIIRVNASMIYSYTENNGISTGNRFSNDIQNALSAPSILPMYDKDGNYYDYDDAQEEGWIYDKFAYNPIGIMVANNNKENKWHRLFANAYIEIQPIKNLKLKSSFGYNLRANSYRTFLPTYNYSDKDVSSDEIVTQTMGMQYALTWENTLAYNFNINDKNSFDLVLGQSMEKSGIGEQLSGSNSNLVFSPEFDYAWLSNTSGVNPTLTRLSGTPYVREMLMSGFGRVNYNYDEKYMLSVMMRADGSSTFAPGKRWGYFPSVSAGWVMSNEKFMESTRDWLDFLKIRASWGQNGNCRIANFQYLASVAYPVNGQYFFTNDKTTVSQGAYATILSNPDITWETSEQVDLGLDANFFNSRLNVNLDFYRKTTKDWLVKAPILASHGTGAPFINGGDIRNQGVELGLGWRDTYNGFYYSVNLNTSYNQNEVTRIANEEGVIEGTLDAFDQNTDVLYRAQVGMPIGYFYGYKTDGIFQNQAQVDAQKAKLEGAAPGDVIFRDLDGDGQITKEDRTLIGNPHPDMIMGLNINLGYKGFDLGITANGAFGHQIIQSYRPLTNKFYSNYNTLVLENRWHGEGTSNTFPRLSNVNNFNKVSDIFVQDADYVRIQNITLGYEFNKLWKESPFKRLRLYASLQNFFTITGYDGFDPAVGYGGPDGWSSGIDFGFYPTAKSVIVGANISF